MPIVADIGRKVKISSQGTVLRVVVAGGGHPAGRPVSRPRGPIMEYTSRSRHRLLEKFGRLDLSRGDGAHITLTFFDPLPSVHKMKAYRRAFCKRMQRRFPRFSSVWRYELGEKTGRPHYEVAAFGLPVGGIRELRRLVQRVWSEVIGWDFVGGDSRGVMTSVKPLTRANALYIAKYTAKPSPQSVGLDYVPYQAEVGRWWGTFNAVALPWAPLFELVCSFGRWFYAYRRVARHVWRRVSGLRYAGFMLFRDDPGRWLGLAGFCGANLASCA